MYSCIHTYILGSKERKQKKKNARKFGFNLKALDLWWYRRFWVLMSDCWWCNTDNINCAVVCCWEDQTTVHDFIIILIILINHLSSFVTNYRLHLVYTVFYLLPILVIELMHVSIIVQSTLYITVLHTSHILVNYKYILS